jgi:hypothetical protein
MLLWLIPAKLGKNGVEITAISRERMYEAVMKRLGLADSEFAQRLQQIEIERRQLEIEKLRKELAGDGDDDEPTPVQININVVDAREEDGDSPTLNIPQARFLAMQHKFKAYVAGFGSGKTWVVARYLQRDGFPKINQGYFAPTYPQIRDIFYPTIEEVAFDWGLNVKINEGNKEVHFYEGRQFRGTTICRSMEKPGSIVGLKSVTRWWMSWTSWRLPKRSRPGEKSSLVCVTRLMVCVTASTSRPRRRVQVRLPAVREGCA